MPVLRQKPMQWGKGVGDQIGGEFGMTIRRAIVGFVIIVFALAALLMPDALYEGWRAPRTDQF